MQGAISAHSLELNVHHLTVSAWNMGNNIVQVSQLNIFEFIPSSDISFCFSDENSTFLLGFTVILNEE